MVFQNHKSRSFRVRRGVPKGSVLGPVLFSLFVNDLPTSLPFSVSCSLYADDLVIWSSSTSVPTAVEVTQAAFPLNAKKVRICEIMSGEFVVKIQKFVKKTGGVW